MKRIFIYIIVLLLSAASIQADDDAYGSLFENDTTTPQSETSTSSTTEDEKNANDFKFNFYGDHFLGFHIPVIPEHFDLTGDIKAPRQGNKLGMELTYPQFKATVNAELDFLFNDWSAWDKVIKFRALENYISWSSWKFTLTAGLQYFSWGLADGINPTDNINPRDYTRGAQAEKLSVLSTSLKFYPADFMSLEMVYLPFEQDDIFPRDIKAEIPAELFYGMGFDSGSFSFYPIAKAKSVTYREWAFDPAGCILGSKFSFFFSGLDLSFSYLYDIDPYWTPELTLNQDAIVGMPAGTYMYNIGDITLVRNRSHRFGIDLKKNIDNFGLWLEACYSLSDDYALNNYKKRNHKLSWVTGFDFNAGPDDLFYLNFQFFGDFIPGFDDKFYKDYTDGRPDQNKAGDQAYMEEYYYRALTDRLGNFTEGLNLGETLNIKLNIHDNLITPSLAISYSLPLLYDYEKYTRYGAFYVKPELDIMPFDSFHVVVGADIYFALQKEGNSLTLDENYSTGNFQKDSNVFIQVEYKWSI